jgi:lipid-A-disaccharide synthase-like uncharacterized protein
MEPQCWLCLTYTSQLLSQYWLYLFGIAGQLLFALRFIVQWVASERKGESIIPIYFWYLSLIGSMILLAYAIFRRDPVFILGQSTGFIVYTRNLMLIYRKRAGSQNFAPS